MCDNDGASLTGRVDDSEAVIYERLKAYEEQTGPVIAHYRQASYATYHRLNGDRSPEAVQRDIQRLLTPVKKYRRSPLGKSAAAVSSL
jgi:adenylate kinase